MGKPQALTLLVSMFLFSYATAERFCFDVSPENGPRDVNNPAQFDRMGRVGKAGPAGPRGPPGHPGKNCECGEKKIRRYHIHVSTNSTDRGLGEVPTPCSPNERINSLFLGDTFLLYR